MTTTATERVGRYQLLEPIGHGPSGKVSRAKVFGVAGFERQFAVKRFHSELTSGQQAQALSTAARAYGGLEHPRIARMSEFGIAQGTTYTAVEYVAGLDAMRLITEVKLGGGMLAAGGALALVSQAARAVGYAHGRGLTHLGLSPTNVVITPEGDVKITDFGILAATLPPRPIEVARLANRIGYLAPEQLTNEATSAATDVFALGVLAYELITGQRTFTGDNPGQIAKAVAGGPPADPPLPKPIMRVLQRCLARSPFERFPDARALADALDAALRVAPVPGTRKDIGSQVKTIHERLADLHSGELSGMLSLDVGTANLGPAAQVAALGSPGLARDSQVEVATMEFVRPDTPVAGPTPLSGPKPDDDEIELELDDNPMPTMPAKPGNVTAKPAIKIPEIPKRPGTPNPVKPPSGLLPKLGARPPGSPTLGKPPSSPIPKPASAPSIPKPPSPDEPSPGNTMQEPIKVPLHTMTGLAPMPIPVPPGLGAPASSPPPANPGTPGTLLGVGRSQQIPKPLVGAVPPPKPGQGPTKATSVQIDGPADRPSESPVSPLRMMSDAPTGNAPVAKISPTKAMADSKRQLFGALRPDNDQAGEARTDLVIETDPGEVFEFQARVAVATDPLPASETSLSVEMEIVEPPPDVEFPPDDDVPSRRPEPATGPADRPTNEMSPILRDELNAHASRPSDELAAWRPKSLDEISAPQAFPSGPPMSEALVEQAPERKTLAGFEPSRSLTAPRAQTPSAAFSQQAERNMETMDVRGIPPKRSAAPKIIAAILGVCALAAVGYVIYDLTQNGSGIAATPIDAAKVAVVDASASPADAMAIQVDAGTATPADAAPASSDATSPAEAMAAIDATPPADAMVATPTGPSDTLSITSTPAGAHVYLDGAESGVTPIKLPGSPDKHNIALLLAGHELYVAKGAAGGGTLAIALKEVTPPGGPAGIKVVKCKDTNRYYVTVDGKQTGMMCPTERIEVSVGDHTIEVYDAVTESVKSFPVSVKDTRLSVRVRVE